MRRPPTVPLAFGCAALAIATLTEAGARVDPDIFPGASVDAAEAAVLGAGGRAPRVLRTDRAFEIVVNYYRVRRKQAVHVVQEPLSAPFERIARALEHGPSAALLSDPLVTRFHVVTFGVARVEPARAAPAWHAQARRVGTRMQQIGEGERVTIYRPYVSRRTFRSIDQTVIVLHHLGG